MMFRDIILPVLTLTIGALLSGFFLIFPQKALSLAGRWTKFLYYEIMQFTDQDVEESRWLFRSSDTGSRSDYIRETIESPPSLHKQILFIRLIGLGIGIVVVFTLFLFIISFPYVQGIKQ